MAGRANWVRISHGVMASASNIAISGEKGSSDGTSCLETAIIHRGLRSSKRHDMWFPDRGAFRPGPEWSSKILGPSADGLRLYGMTGGKEQCLVEIDPDGMTKLRSACGPAIAPADRAWPSPDGRWLVTTGPTSVLLYDLTTVWSHPTAISGPKLENATGVVWYDDESFVVSTPGWLLRMYFHQVGRSEELPAVASPGATLQVIPRLGPP